MREKQHRSPGPLTIFLSAMILALPLILYLLTPTSSTRGTAALAAQPQPMSLFGMNTYFTGLERFWNDGDSGILTLVEKGREAGVQWGREEISWANLQYARGMWNRDNRRLYDQHILEMAQADYGIIGILLTTPDWARVSDCQDRVNQYDAVLERHEYWCPPADVNDYASFVQGIVERYDGDGVNDAPGSPRIAVWQIWNEPNHWETWPGTPAEYAALLKAGYAAAKAADPTAIVATGGLYILDGQSAADSDGCECHKDGLYFFDRVLEADPTAWDSFDALAIHPYMPYNAPDSTAILSKVTLWGRVQTANDWMAAKQQQYDSLSRPVWISEIGWTTCSNTAQAAVASADDARLARYRIPAKYWKNGDAQLSREVLCKTEQEQADYMLRSYAIAEGLGVQHLNFHQLEDKFDTQDRDIWQGTAILNTVATSYTPKLAYHAYGVLTQQLADTSFYSLGSLHTYAYDPNAQNNPSGRYHLRYRTTTSEQVDVLWLSSGTQQVAVSLEAGVQSAQLVSLDGQETTLTPVDGVVSFALDEHPVYLRQQLPPPTPTPTGTVPPTATPTSTPTPTPTPVPGDAYEPDNTCATTRTITVDGQVQQHTFHLPGDTDWTGFAVVTSTTYLVEAHVPPESQADVSLKLSTSCSGSPVASQDRSIPHVWMTYEPETDGTAHLSLANHDSSRAGTAVTYDLSVCALPITRTGAFILVAGGLDTGDPLQATVDDAADTFSAMLHDQGYTEEQVRYFSAIQRPFTSTLPLEQAITDDAARLLGPDDLLTIYITGYGASDSIYLDKPGNVQVTTADLNAWLTELEMAVPGVRIMIVLDSSFAGSFIRTPDTVSFPGRVVITSTGAQHPAWATEDGVLFSNYFLTSLRQGASISTAFQDASWAVRVAQGDEQTEATEDSLWQTPWMDDDGNGTSDEADGSVSQQCDYRVTGAQTGSALPPYIAEAVVEQDTIRARVQDDAGEAVQVAAIIYPPDYDPPVSAGELIRDTSIITLELHSEGSSGDGTWYEQTYQDFTTPGTYHVVVQARNESGLQALPREVPVTVTSLEFVYLPLIVR